MHQGGTPESLECDLGTPQHLRKIRSEVYFTEGEGLAHDPVLDLPQAARETVVGSFLGGSRPGRVQLVDPRDIHATDLFTKELSSGTGVTGASTRTTTTSRSMAEG